MRIEIYDGQIFYMADASQLHQELSNELSYSITSYIKSKKGICKIFTAPFDVKLNDTPLVVVQPDIMLICDKNKLDGKRCNGAPDFIIEITSPSNSPDDYVKKLYYYQTYGVREYWIVDAKNQSITVYYFKDDPKPTIYTFQDKVKVNIYDDLYLDFKELNI